MSVKIAPSILSADFGRLAEEVRAVEAAGASAIHVDVMDGHFVPNLTIGPVVVKALRRVTELSLDVHLMVTDPDALIPAFAEAGADSMTVHVEAVHHLDRTLELIRSLDKRVGVALNPATPASLIEPVLGIVDLVLVMTVNPGFGGQRFIPYTLDKIHLVRELIRAHGHACAIQVDGGIRDTTVDAVVGAGADILVVGSALFDGTPDPGQRLRELLEKASMPSYHP